MASKHKLTVQESQNASLGQAGSILVKDADVAVTALNGVFVAIQFLEDTIFKSSGGLVAETEQLYLDDTGTSTSVSAANGDTIDGITFPQGMTIYGRWTAFTLASGKVVAYIG
tara:strand:+ start:3763 stop:4101 length:339 start_codon:yes stop_codon:yes gene_type:complete